MNQFWLIWQRLTKSTDWLRDGQGKATNGSGKNCFHLGCIQKMTFRVAQNAKKSQNWRLAIKHYNIINRASLVGDEEKRKMYPPIAVAITRISECWEPPLLPPGLLPSGVPLCPSPLPSIWNILTPSLTLTFLWHFSSTPPFTWLLKSLPLGDKHFLKLLTSEQSFSLSPRSQTVANVARPTKRRSQLVAERDGEQLASSGSDRRRSHSLIFRMSFCFPYRYNISGPIYSFMSNESPKDCENMTHL